MRKRCHRQMRPVLRPLGIKNEVEMELLCRIGALALDQEWVGMQHLRDIGAHALLCELVAATMGDAEKAASAARMIGVLVAVEDRHDRHGQAEVSTQDMQTLRDGLAETLPWLTAQPNLVIYRASEQLVRRHDRLRDVARRAVAA